MEVLSLNGEWKLNQVGRGGAIPAVVPGCVHTDLLAADKIPDPFYRDNELRVMWISDVGWVYKRSFRVPAALLEHDRVVLRCEGLDTLATVLVNDREVGRAYNMFRTWEFDVAGVLQPGVNRIEVRFDPPVPYVREREAERFLPGWGAGQDKIVHGGWIRKEPCSFGWDWGPRLCSSGIWRDIEVVGYDTARLGQVRVTQDHSRRGKVGLSVGVEVDRCADAALTAKVTVAHEGQVVAEQTVPVAGSAATAELTVREPKLWWPNGMGEQPLYEVTVELTGEAGVLDTWQKRVGLRTLVLDRHPDEWGESFQFVANGVPFFAKGANWIPADTFVTRLTRDDYARLIGDAAAANMNMLRVWGGGIYEDDAFYELCDELGICAWQDFMFGCGTYPGFDTDFLANLEQEFRDNLRRIRHHACIAFYCGNNELEQGLVGDAWTDHQMSWEDYGTIFDELLPRVISEEDPGRDYWPSSPHTPPPGDRKNFNDPDRGDAHLWNVWHGKQPFEWYRTCRHRFNSEFGFQSFPEPRTVETYTAPDDRNVTSYVMEHHQRSGIGNSTIMHYLLDWFRLPTSFESTLWLSQILQGMAIKYACEHWRRAMPRGMGTLYWQINDCWPVASWSSIDSLGRWKALHFMARQFFAPLLVSGLEDAAEATVDIHVTSDRLEAADGEVTWTVTDAAGNVLEEGGKPVKIGPRRDAKVATVRLRKHVNTHGTRNLLVWLGLKVGGEVVSTNLVTLSRPKHLELGDPGIRAVVATQDGRTTVTLTSERPALWTWLALADIDARWSDNFVHLRPGEVKVIEVTPATTLTAKELDDRLVVRSLVDTYR